MKLYQSEVHVRFMTTAESPADAESRLRKMMIGLNAVLGNLELLVFSDMTNPDIITTEVVTRKD